MAKARKAVERILILIQFSLTWENTEVLFHSEKNKFMLGKVFESGINKSFEEYLSQNLLSQLLNTHMKIYDEKCNGIPMFIYVKFCFLQCTR